MRLGEDVFFKFNPLQTNQLEFFRKSVKKLNDTANSVKSSIKRSTKYTKYTNQTKYKVI